MNYLERVFDLKPVTEIDLKMAIRYDRNYRQGYDLGFYDGMRSTGLQTDVNKPWFVGFKDGYEDGHRKGRKRARERA